MKKLITKLLIFFFIFLVILLSVTRFDNVARCYNANPNIQKLTVFNSFDSLDILFLGNSYCYSGINPACFDSAGIRTFNLGVATGGVNFYRILINDYVSSVKKAPKAVFLLLSPMTLSSKSDDATNNAIYRYLNKPISNEEYIARYDPSLLKSYPKIAARSFAKTFVNLYGYFTSKKNYCQCGNNEICAAKGFIRSDNVTNPKDELKTNHFFYAFSKEIFDTARAQKFITLAADMEKKNIQVVFYELPSNKLYSFYNPLYIKQYQNFIASVKSKYTFLAVQPHINQSQYRDQDHLNAAGSIIASNEMIKQIKNNKSLSNLFFNRKN